MQELYGVIGLHLSKVKTDINKYGEFDYYSIVGCKIISILNGDTLDISVKELVSGLLENKIINTDGRLYYADRARIRIKRGLVKKHVFIYDHLKNREPIFYNLYLGEEIILKPDLSLVSLLSSHSTDDYYTTLSLIYDYSEEKLFLSVELNYEFDYLRYYYLDGTHRYTIFEGVGNCYAVNTSNLYGIDLKGFFNCYERYGKGILRVNNYYFIGSDTSGDIIVPNGCTDLVLGHIGVSGVKTLVVPPSVSSVSSGYEAKIQGFELCLSSKLSYKVKFDICKAVLGLGYVKEFDGDFEKVEGLVIY